MDSNASVKEKETSAHKIHIHTTGDSFWNKEEYSIISISEKHPDANSSKYPDIFN